MEEIGIPVTETLYVRSCPFDHVVAVTTVDALALYQSGQTVCVPTPEIALAVLLLDGLDATTAQRRAAFARDRMQALGMTTA